MVSPEDEGQSKNNDMGAAWLVKGSSLDQIGELWQPERSALLNTKTYKKRGVIYSMVWGQVLVNWGRIAKAPEVAKPKEV